MQNQRIVQFGPDPRNSTLSIYGGQSEDLSIDVNMLQAYFENLEHGNQWSFSNTGKLLHCVEPGPSKGKFYDPDTLLDEFFVFSDEMLTPAQPNIPLQIPLNNSAKTPASQLNSKLQSLLKAYKIPKMPKDAFIDMSVGGIKRYRCTHEGCTKEFTRRGTNAKSHWLAHQQVMPYQCPDCQRRFLRQNNLQKHIANGCKTMKKALKSDQYNIRTNGSLGGE